MALKTDLTTAPVATGASGEAVPAHVAIIMDGNGRWAARRGLPRVEGHRRGVEAVRRTVRSAIELGIRYLTIYSFSAENWRRPPQEVSDLMGLLKRFIRHDLADLHANNVRVRIIGDRAALSPDIGALLDEAEELTRRNPGLTLVVAFNYGGRQELVRAVRAIAEKVRRGEIDPAAIDADTVDAALDTIGIPDPDLVIRTSGEQRISNFLLWQSAYAEYVFLPDLWPDFDEARFRAAIEEYAGRERRFGGRSWRDRSWAAGGFTYAAVIAVVPPLVREHPRLGLVAILWMFAVVWLTDIAAYFAGRRFGGPKLWPRVSPKKTWSGFFGGLVAGVAAGGVVVLVAGRFGVAAPVSFAIVVLFSAVASVLSQLGDLGESALKRRFGAKDSGVLIPGHGGVMDRLDGFWAAAALIGLVLAGVQLRQGWAG